MKILMVTPYLPYPLHSGGQTRSFNLIKHLAKNCEITLFSFIRDVNENQYIKNLSPYCRKIKTFPRGKTWSLKKILLAGFTPYSFLIANYYSRKMKKIIQEEVKKGGYDLIHVECFYLMSNIPKTKLPVVLVDQTIEYEVYRHYVQSLPLWTGLIKPLLYFDVLKLFLWEKFYWRKASQVCAVSREDKKKMIKHCHRLRVEVVQNGVDIKKFEKRIYRRASRPTILFGVANFKWMQNKEAALILLQEVWPQIKNKVKNCQLWIIGRFAPQFLSHFTNEKDITIKEADDILPFYQKSWLLLAPIKSGGGSRTKFFEAMASGLPIITTPQGAEGIKAKNNKEVIIRRSNRQLANAAIKLIKNRLVAREIGKRGKKLITNKYSWQQSAEELNRVYKNV